MREDVNDVKIPVVTRESYHHGDLRRALLEAAERLVRRVGAGDASLRAIAREAGVSAAAPYHHFEDRESLLAAVAARGFRSLGSGMADAHAACGAEGPLERLRAAGIAYVRFAVDNAEMFRLMFGGTLSDRSRYPELEEAADATWAVLEGLMDDTETGAEQQESGSYRPAEREAAARTAGRTTSGPDRPHPPVALATWSTVHGLAFLLVEGLLRQEEAELGVEEITRGVTQVLGRGLRAYGQPGRS